MQAGNPVTMQAGNPVTMLERRTRGTGRGHMAALMDQRLDSASYLYNRDLRGHFGCINAIEFSGSGSLMVSGGDDRRVLVWDVARTISGSATPTVPLVSQHLSNIFCLAFDAAEKHVFSAGNDKQVIVHDLITGAAVDVFTEQQAVYGLHVDPCQEKVFVASCENGRVLLFDLRMSLSDPLSLAEEGASLAAYYSAMFSPAESRLVATANSKSGAAVYDVAMPGRVLQRYGGSRYGAMSARYSSDGRRLFVLRRRLPPVLYDLRSSPAPLCQFDNPLYYNSCTMKSCCFAGSRDQYVLSGSDDFSLYMWKIPDDPEVRHVSRAHAVLRGHRSIVNQVRFCPQNGLLASSGVEKVVKLWSPMRLPDSQGGLTFEPERDGRQRRIPRQGEYIDMMVSAAEDAFGPDMNAQTTEEDPRMLAFFDSLVQREIEALTTETDTSSEEDGVGRGGRTQHSSDDTAEHHSYFAATSDLEEANRGCDNIISKMIDLKRGQLMRAARLRRRRAQGGGGGSSSGGEDKTASALDGRRRRVLHKARYVWLPMAGRQVTTRYTARAPPAAELLISDDSSDSSDASDPTDPTEDGSGGPEPRPAPGAAPLRRPGRLPVTDEQPSGSGLQSSASSSGGPPRPSRPLSSASSETSSSESSDEPPPRRRRLGKLLTTLGAESDGEESPAPSPPPPPAAAAAAAAAERREAPLTNGNTKDNFSRLKRSDFRRRNYRRRH